MGNVLIIDDEEGIRTVLRDVLQDEGHTVHTAEDGFVGLDTMDREPVDLVILDVWLPNMGGMDVLKRLKEDYADVEVIIISGHASIDLAVQATKMGAYNFLEKPLSLENTVALVRNALQLEDLRRENRRLRNSMFLEDEMIGASTAMEGIKQIISQSAPTDSRILITGENGTGKELVAREIHNRSRRAEGPFVEVNCAAIPETLIESELFGHEKGAFTGAISARKGKFELAHRGTLFLDEIGDMSMGTQAKVLRVIQELTFERIGGEQSISVDVRLIAATNKNLAERIRDRGFREDLYFRLNVIPIHVPPLRERIEDIGPLIGYFMEKFRLPSRPEPKTVSPEALEILSSYRWPGNIRELKNFVERVNIMSDHEEITRDDVESYLGASRLAQPPVPFQDYLDMGLSQAREQFERDLITYQLKKNGFNITRTAEEMGVRNSTLYGRINKYRIALER